MQILNAAKGKAHKNGNQNVTGKAGNMKPFRRKKETKYNIYEEALMIFTAEVNSGKLDNCFKITEEHAGNNILSVKYVFKKPDHIFNNMEFTKILNYGITTKMYHGILNDKKIDYAIQDKFADAMDEVVIRKSKQLENKIADSLNEYIKQNNSGN